MREFAFATHRTIIFKVEFFTGVFIWFRSRDLSFNVMLEVAVHSILAVTSEVVDAGIEKSINMESVIGALGVERSSTLVNSKVLVGAQ